MEVELFLSKSFHVSRCAMIAGHFDGNCVSKFYSSLKFKSVIGRKYAMYFIKTLQIGSCFQLDSDYVIQI